MSNRQEPAIGTATGMGGLFTGKKKVRTVSSILGGFSTLVAELQGAVQHHKAKITENEKKIAELNVENTTSNVEIDDATHAMESIQSLIQRKV